MYEEFFGFRTRPFSVLPDSEFLYLSRGHRFALSLLEFGLGDQTGYTVITGEIGSGKTTLVNHLLDRSAANHIIGLITNTAMINDAVMPWLFHAFDLPYASEDDVTAYKRLVGFLTERSENGQDCVLIIDEAQHLSHKTLETLRLISNINVGKRHLLKLILVGQPELLDTLARPDLTQFAQRISANFHLNSLNLLETREYIRTRLMIAGGVGTIFDDLACDFIFVVTGGTPRQINILCDTALIYAYAESQLYIDLDIVIAVLKDRATSQRLGLGSGLTLEELDRARVEQSIGEVRKREFAKEAERELKSSGEAKSSIPDEEVARGQMDQAELRAVGAEQQQLRSQPGNVLHLVHRLDPTASSRDIEQDEEQPSLDLGRPIRPELSMNFDNEPAVQTPGRSRSSVESEPVEWDTSVMPSPIDTSGSNETWGSDTARILSQDHVQQSFPRLDQKQPQSRRSRSSSEQHESIVIFKDQDDIPRSRRRGRLLFLTVLAVAFLAALLFVGIREIGSLLGAS